jgi:hypothetical protein
MLRTTQGCAAHPGEDGLPAPPYDRAGGDSSSDSFAVCIVAGLKQSPDSSSDSFAVCIVAGLKLAGHPVAGAVFRLALSVR